MNQYVGHQAALRSGRPGRLKRLVDSIPHLPMFRADVETGIFARRLVTVTLQEIFHFEYENTPWAAGELIALDTSISDGALEYSWQEMGHTGRAKIVADDATDIPFVDLEGRDNLRSIKTVACAFRYTDQQVRTAQLQGRFDIASEKAAAAREAHDLELNDLLKFGSVAHGLDGATNVPGIFVVNAATGGWLTGATPEQIIADFTAAANVMPNNTSGIEMPNQSVFALNLWTHIKTTPIDPAQRDNTILQFLQAAHPNITKWTWDVGLETASQTGGPAVMIQRQHPTRMRGVIPMTLQAFPPEQRDMTFKVILKSRFGGVMAPKPLGTLRLDGA